MEVKEIKLVDIELRTGVMIDVDMVPEDEVESYISAMENQGYVLCCDDEKLPNRCVLR